MQTELSRQFYKRYGTLQKPQLSFPLRSSLQTLFSLWARAQHAADSGENESYSCCQHIYSKQAKCKCGKLHTKHRHRYGGATPGMGLRRGCDQSKHTFNYHSANTYEDLWLRVSRKSVVAVPMEVAPRARSCRVKGQRTLNRMRQPQNTSLHDFLSILSEAVGEKQIIFSISSVHRSFELHLVPLFPILNSSASKALFMLLTSMNSHYFPAIRALSKEAHNLFAKFRIEKDPRRSWCNQYSKTASMFEFSHLFLRCWPA